MQRYRTVIIAGVLIAGVVAVASAWLASGHPDGLERVAEDKQFLDQAKDPSYEVLPGYSIPGVDGPLSTAIAGVVGVAVLAGLMLGAGRLLRAPADGGGQGDAPAPDARRKHEGPGADSGRG